MVDICPTRCLLGATLAACLITGCRGTAAETGSAYRQVRIRGLPVQARVDPDSGTIAWRALTCMNPACPAAGQEGAPYLFANVTPGATIGEGGEVMMPAPQSADYEIPQPKCPVCGAGGESVVPYDPPDLRLQMMDLQTELENTRRARDEGRPSGRTPTASAHPRRS